MGWLFVSEKWGIGIANLLAGVMHNLLLCEMLACIVLYMMLACRLWLKAEVTGNSNILQRLRANSMCGVIWFVSNGCPIVHRGLRWSW